MFTLQRFTPVLAAIFLILGSHSDLQTASSSPVIIPKHNDSHAQMAFAKYDYNNDQAIDQNEFTAFFMSTFAADEKRYLKPSAVKKLFEYLDIVGDGKMNSEVFRKAFQRWYNPIVATKSCLFLCVPHGITNSSELELKTSQLIEQTQAFFKIQYVFISACNDENRTEPIDLLVKHVQKLLPKAYDIKVYNAHSHLTALQNKDFDQLIVNFANIKHDQTALKGLMAHNSPYQHPTVVMASEKESSELDNYFDSEHLHSAIIVDPTLDARDRAKYKSEFALVLARKIFRKYKKLIH
ncbi:hypothetical protein TYRP_001289 [Tyrophagus putrescentiae]|nr:hypothetical protein TYRP_001289 [Tyrophagus putrescentiae]